MDKIADQVAAGVSTYHIHNAKVVRHIVDNIEVDKDKVSHFHFTIVTFRREHSV